VPEGRGSVLMTGLARPMIFVVAIAFVAVLAARWTGLALWPSMPVFGAAVVVAAVISGRPGASARGSRDGGQTGSIGRVDVRTWIFRSSLLALVGLAMLAIVLSVAE